MCPQAFPLAVVLLLGALSGAACGKHADGPSGTDAVSPGAVAAATRLAQSDLDNVPTQIDGLLSYLASVDAETSDQLRIRLGDDFVYLDWWMSNRGLIEFRSVDQNVQPLVGLTPFGAIKIPKYAPWFIARVALDRSSTCRRTGTAMFVTCSLKLVYTPAITRLGKTIAGAVTLPPMIVTDSVAWDGATWTADPVDYGAAGNPTTVVLTALLGPPGRRDAARQKYLVGSGDSGSCPSRSSVPLCGGNGPGKCCSPVK